MRFLKIHSDRPLHFVMTGKFEAPSDAWTHEELPLGEFELFVVTHGTLFLIYNHQSYTVPDGSYLLLPPVPAPDNIRKGFKTSDCDFYWLHFSAEFELDDDLTIVGPDIMVFPEQSVLLYPEKVIVQMKQLQDANRSSYAEISLNYMASVVMAEIYSQTILKSQSNLPVQKTQKQIYYDIVDFIHLNLHRSLKVSDVADYFGYNDKYLSHLFCCVAGISLKQYILTVKTDYANFLLTDTNQTIRQIASAVGYSDSQNFCRIYKKTVGLTPLQYRNAYAKRLLYHK